MQGLLFKYICLFVFCVYICFLICIYLFILVYLTIFVYMITNLVAKIHLVRFVEIDFTPIQCNLTSQDDFG